MRTERAAATLVDVAEHHGSRVGPPGPLYRGELVDETQERVIAIVPIAVAFLIPSAAGVAICEIPATTWAVLVHTYGFRGVRETYPDARRVNRPQRPRRSPGARSSSITPDWPPPRG